eukprot:TRINITY_DN14176_c0_g1_i1.p1 TRINITY_DN14176_c0_g1~~TRINITY_DN14176_c0_g1_i1.p1  ORF type:complete len:192 (+),score=19.88 TRINITY_DN14176_c0_g1_i1:98-673(+)
MGRKLLRHNAAFLVHQASLKLVGGIGKGISLLESWNKHAGISLVDAAEAHTIYFTFKSFYSKVLNVHNERVREVLLRLVSLYAIHSFLRKPIGALESGYLEARHLGFIREAKEILLNEIRPDVIALTDGLHFSDNILRSAIGRYEGKPYETLWSWVTEHNRFDKEDIRAEVAKEISTLRGKRFTPVMIPRI